MEIVSFLVAGVAVAVSVQVVMIVAVLGFLIFAMLFSVVPVLVGWVASKLTPGESGLVIVPTAPRRWSNP